MNKLTIMIATVLLVLGGCDRTNESASVRPCSMLAHVKIISTDQNDNFAILKVVPKRVRVCVGGQIELTFAPPRPLNTVSTKPDGANHPNGANPGPDGWLVKENSANKNEMMIDVLPGTEPGDYKYSVTIVGVGTLDPYA
ncbi:MAG: hypothetical protein O6844_09685, partial [Gammaproteobacteria bacterium]|nr:hypothetical protein [Gammaproteobacteria bacterium]